MWSSDLFNYTRHRAVTIYKQAPFLYGCAGGGSRKRLLEIAASHAATFLHAPLEGFERSCGGVNRASQSAKHFRCTKLLIIRHFYSICIRKSITQHWSVNCALSYRARSCLRTTRHVEMTQLFVGGF